MTPVVLSGGTLTDLAGQPSTSSGAFYPLDVVPRLDKNGTIVDLERTLAALGDPEWVYRTQPAVRMVVDWRVDKMIRVPIHAYIKAADDSRTEERGIAEQTITNPMPGRGQAAWLSEILYDWHLHERWCLAVTKEPGRGFGLLRIPPRRWRPLFNGLGIVTDIQIDGRDKFDPATFVFDYGRGGGTSPMKTLQDVLTELVEGARYRRDAWAKGIRQKAIVERPADAPDWTKAGLERFQTSFGEQWMGPDAIGEGVPVLEDGMQLKTVELLTASDTEYLEGLRLNAMFVAGVFKTKPENVGLRPGNYANMDALRQSIYREDLGADFTRLEQALQQLIPRYAPMAQAGTYYEFLIEAALRGSFMEQHEIYQTAVGAPYMLRSEPREQLNLDPVDGFDQPIVPLNVLVGGLANPRDTAGDRANLLAKERREIGEKASSGDWRGVIRGRLADELAGYFDGLHRHVVGQLGETAKAAPAGLDLDTEAWNKELAAILLRYGYTAATTSAQEVLSRFQAKDGDFSEDRMLAWLAAAAGNTASRINEATKQEISGAVAEGGAEWRDHLDDLFTVYATTRSVKLGASMVTETASFGAHEAARVVGARTKTWHTTSPHPRTSHAALGGETVGADEVFSNGLRYPGDSRGSAAETAGCTCSITYGNGGENQ